MDLLLCLAFPSIGVFTVVFWVLCLIAGYCNERRS